MGEYQSWSDYMLSYQSGQSKLAGLASDNGIDTSLVEKATALLLKHRNLFAQVQPRLLHTDFSPKHILVNGDHITGLIDFENCKGGDNSFDFAWWDYFYRNQNHLKWLREGYQELGELGENFDLRLQLMKVYFGLMFLEWYGEQKNPAISHVKETFRVDIEALT
jgi:aminoglycoside phosphotransferase (APT) family kinase protein